MQCDKFRVENLGCEDESFYHLSHLKLENTEVGSEERKGERERWEGQKWSEKRGVRRGRGEREKRRGEEGEWERRGRERRGMVDKEWKSKRYHCGGVSSVHTTYCQSAIKNVSSSSSSPPSLLPSSSQDRRVPGGATLPLHPLA